MSPAPRRRAIETRDHSLPCVSVIVPVKDTTPALLHAAVASAVRQDYTGPIDIVVWDDGSTGDATLDSLAKLRHAGEADRPIRVGGTPDNRGISAARNAACQVACGTWYLWLDSDDTLPLDAVRNLLHAVGSHPQLVFGRCRVSRPGGATEIHHAEGLLNSWRRARNDLDDPLLSAVFAVHGGLVHRDLFWGVDGFDESLSYAELTDWVLRVLARIDPDRVALVRETTYHHVQHTASHSSARAELERHRTDVLRRYGQPSFDRPVRHRFARRCELTGARLYDVLSDSGVSLLLPAPGP